MALYVSRRQEMISTDNVEMEQGWERESPEGGNRNQWKDTGVNFKENATLKCVQSTPAASSRLWLDSTSA